MGGDGQMKRGEKRRRVTRGRDWEQSAGWELSVSQHESGSPIWGERG